MHGHLTGGNDALNERILLLSVARGITTVRGMLGHPSHLVLRERVRKGELLGPTIYTSGPSLNGNTVPDAASAEKLATTRSAVAVVDALVPVCVAQSKLDPNGAAKITAMTGMVTNYEKRDFVMKAGWATTSGSENANSDVASACADVLVKARQS